MSNGVSKVFKIDTSSGQYNESSLTFAAVDMYWKNPGVDDLDLYFIGVTTSLTDGSRT